MNFEVEGRGRPPGGLSGADLSTARPEVGPYRSSVSGTETFMTGFRAGGRARPLFHLQTGLLQAGPPQAVALRTLTLLFYSSAGIPRRGGRGRRGWVAGGA